MTYIEIRMAINRDLTKTTYKREVRINGSLLYLFRKFFKLYQHQENTHPRKKVATADINFQISALLTCGTKVPKYLFKFNFVNHFR